MDDSAIKNWIPYKLINNQGQLQCHWLNAFDVPFKEPFFDETILKLRGYDSKHALIEPVSDLSMLVEWGSDLMPVQPSAFIFHISRCGSTLISQLLSLSDQNIVLPEVPFFDDLLRLSFQDKNFPQKTSSELLELAIKFYGQKRTGNERYLYIKTDSWHMFFYKQLRALYPNVPFILLYRNPVEVFSSLKRKPALHSVPGLIEPEIFGFDEQQIVTDMDSYIQLVIEKYLQQYL